jgi:hypothetical protein
MAKRPGGKSRLSRDTFESHHPGVPEKLPDGRCWPKPTHSNAGGETGRSQGYFGHRRPGRCPAGRSLQKSFSSRRTTRPRLVQSAVGAPGRRRGERVAVDCSQIDGAARRVRGPGLDGEVTRTRCWCFRAAASVSTLHFGAQRLRMKILPIAIRTNEQSVQIITLKNRTPNPIAKAFRR